MLKTNRLSSSFLMLLALSVSSSFASDLQCDNGEKQRYEELLCDYPALNSQYDNIYRQQEELTNVGRLPQGVYETWRSKLKSCVDVSCVSAVFDEWEAIDSDIEKPEPIQEQPSSTVVKIVEPPTPMEPIVVVPPSDTYQSGKDSGSGWSGLIGLIPWLIAVGFLNYYMFSTQCPKCRRFFARTERGREELVDDTALEENDVEDEHHNSQEEKTDSTEGKVQVMVPYTKYRVYYRCKKCGAEWDKVVGVRR